MRSYGMFLSIFFFSFLHRALSIFVHDSTAYFESLLSLSGRGISCFGFFLLCRCFALSSSPSFPVREASVRRKSSIAGADIAPSFRELTIAVTFFLFARFWTNISGIAVVPNTHALKDPHRAVRAAAEPPFIAA